MSRRRCCCGRADCRLPEAYCGCPLPRQDLTLSTPDGDVTMAYVESAGWTGWWGLLSHTDTHKFFNPSDSIDYMGDDGLGGCNNFGEMNVLFRMTCSDGDDYPISMILARDAGSNCPLSRGVLRWAGAVGASRPFIGVPWNPADDYEYRYPPQIPTDEVCSCSPLSVEFQFYPVWRWDDLFPVTLTLTL